MRSKALTNGAPAIAWTQARLRVLAAFMHALRPESTTPPAAVAPADPVTNAFEVLGVPVDAARVEVKACYRALAKQWHPDLVVGDPARCAEADARMAEINAAYAVICHARGW